MGECTGKNCSKEATGKDGLCDGCRISKVKDEHKVEPSEKPSKTKPCSDCTKKTFPPKEVDKSVTQTISNAPTAYSAWNGTYSWHSKFTLTVKRPECKINVKIKIKVSGSITNTQKSAWKTKIESKWSNKVKLICNDPACSEACKDGSPVIVELEYVSSGEHYTVTANASTATEGGRSGIGGTTSMTGWGVGDTVDITHEFGHMLGNADEYFTTNGVDYTGGGTKRAFREPTAGVMNNPAKNPRKANYDFIKKQVEKVIGGGTSCQIETI